MIVNARLSSLPDHGRRVESPGRIVSARPGLGIGFSGWIAVSTTTSRDRVITDKGSPRGFTSVTPHGLGADSVTPLGLVLWYRLGQFGVITFLGAALRASLSPSSDPPPLKSALSFLSSTNPPPSSSKWYSTPRFLPIRAPGGTRRALRTSQRTNAAHPYRS